MSTLFVTAIGTDSGKTHASCAILRELRARGREVLALKPLMSGFSPDKLGDSDAGRLLLAMGREATPAAVADICWKSFPEWSAPNVAARRAGVPLAYDQLLTFLQTRMAGFTGTILVEGAGGIMSPLTDEKTNIDLAMDLRAPVLLMASNYLGAVSHTLTALEALERRGLEVAAIGVTQSLPNAGLAAPLVEELARWTRHRIVTCGFSRGPEDDRGWAGPLTTLLFG
jgi:dethiobiotin synthetase